MNRLLLLSHKVLIFVLKPSTEYNINFIFSKLSFYSTVKICVLRVSKLLDLLFFLLSKKQVFQSQLTFLQSRNLSTIKELFDRQGILPESRNFSTVVEIFHSQGNFLEGKIRRFLQKLKFLSHSVLNLTQKY